MSTIQEIKKDLKIALVWCLAWGEELQPKCDRQQLETAVNALRNNGEVPPELAGIVTQVEHLQNIPDDDQPEDITALKKLAGDLWNQTTPIGLVYGGVTKVKGYVFESANLMEIRGASAILDRINLIDLPAFFGQQKPDNDLEDYRSPRDWLNREFPQLSDALIPELIIYATGGNILAFCPAAYVDTLANAIEKRYTHETLTANSCAVGDKFRLLEIRFGMLAPNLDDTPWFDWYKKQVNNPLVEAYFGNPKAKNSSIDDCFFNAKSFNQLTRKLAIRFNQRRSGNATENRPSRSYPPHLETHPYLVRDTNDRTSAIDTVEGLPSKPKFSEPIARKYFMGQVTKRDDTNRNWYQSLGLTWQPGYVKSWVKKFENYLDDSESEHQKYYGGNHSRNVTESRNMEEIANSSNYFLSMIYADGNNMGGYIQQIKTPEKYRQFSQDILEATEKSVYYALAKNLHPHQLKNLRKPDNRKRENAWVHPFEIIAIGGDDVMIMVPANKSLAIAKDIGEKFEEILAAKGRYNIIEKSPEPNNIIEKSTEPRKPGNIHRYLAENATHYDSILSTSMGVLTIKYDTPIYYANHLVSQLLKSAKEKAKKLKKDYSYFGGTVDILTLKSVTMISSNIKKFREDGLVVNTQPKLKLYAAPYTLHEVGGLIKTIQAFKKVDFPRSQLYQIRSFLERGKRTAILNYRYFCVRLKSDNRRIIKDDFEDAWCLPQDKNNNGNLAPWMSIVDDKTTIYETLWREIIDLYPFIEIDYQSESEKPQETEVSKS